MTRFLLIRHATNDTVGKLLAGRTPGVHLNEEGKRQAQELAERLKKLSITAIYSSPLERTMETAAPMAEMLNLAVQVCDDLLEMEYGDWTGNSFDELRAMPEFHRFNVFRSNSRVPGGESMLESQTRIVTVIEQLAARHNNETVVLVSHADIIKSAIAFFAGIHLDMFQRLEISPSSVSILELFDDTARLMLINHTGGIEF